MAKGKGKEVGNEKVKMDKDVEEFYNTLDSLFEKINYYGQIEEVLMRGLDYKIREIACEAVEEHEKEYHAKEGRKGDSIRN